MGTSAYSFLRLSCPERFHPIVGRHAVVRESPPATRGVRGCDRRVAPDWPMACITGQPEVQMLKHRAVALAVYALAGCGLFEQPASNETRAQPVGSEPDDETCDGTTICYTPGDDDAGCWGCARRGVCEEQATRCFDQNPSCASLFRCLDDCSSGGFCVEGCLASHPDGVADAKAFGDCMCDRACPNDCAAMCDY
jgi:hypothetical protein